MESGRGETSAGGRRRVFVLALIGCLAGVLVIVTSASAAYPGANGRIIYSTGRGPSYRIHTVLPSGQGDTVISDRGREFTWSPNGRRVVFVADSQSRIYTMRSDGGDVRQLTSDGFNYGPQYSPRGYRIAFTHLGTVTVMHSDGSDRHVLSKGSLLAWTPDGRIAYSCSSGLCVMRGDGTHREHLVRLGSAGGGGPIYSPDGDRFIFSRCEEGASHAVSCTSFIANSDGTAVHRAPCHLNYADDYSPGGGTGERIPITYSPNGNWLLVGVLFMNDYGIFTVNLVRVSLQTCAGTRVAVRTRGTTDWQPLPTGTPTAN